MGALVRLFLFVGMVLVTSLGHADDGTPVTAREAEVERVRQSYFGAGSPYYPGVLGVPEAEYNKIVEGYKERARVNSHLQRIIYSGTNAERAELVKAIPELKLLLGITDKGELSKSGGFHAGFASELMGKVHPAHLGRLYAPDIWRVRPPGSNGRYKVVVGEENGGNPGGADRLKLLAKIFSYHPEYGKVPSNGEYHRRMMEHIRQIAQDFKPGVKNPVFVYLTEDSLRTKEVEFEFQGKRERIKPPNPKPAQLIEDTRKHFEKLGVVWLSSVDPEDKRRIFVENNVLYLLQSDGKGGEKKVKVDILYTRMDVEMVDSTYKEQVERNRIAGRADMTHTGKLVGVPGLIKAWLHGQNPSNPADRGFVWVNGLTSMLTTNKIWPSLIDLYIERVEGKKPILPLLKTHYYVTADGRFDRERFEADWKRNADFVVKQTLGQGGKQVQFPVEMSPAEVAELKEHLIKELTSNPFSYALQVRMELAQLALDFLGKLKKATKLFHDYRLIGFISPYGQSLMKHIMIRLSKSLKINVSQGGSMGMGVKADTKRLEPVPPVSMAKAPRCGLAVKSILYKPAR